MENKSEQRSVVVDKAVPAGAEVQVAVGLEPKGALLKQMQVP